ncbi:rRNA maturation RNase YbeY [Rudaea sp.]|uniref:rRNA maturation RNase YbeY n=1 Tax=Rudaea sp. TaxID=2136325 RepID=UPI0032200FE1
MSARLDLRVFVQNDFGRGGVPVSRSFETWVRAALSGRRRGRTGVNIALLDSDPARELNLRYRGKDYATNVLSFAYEPAPREKSGLLGDLVLCPPVVAREAAEQGKRVRDHYAHLTVHGVLHLLGYDHENEREARKMEAIERDVLAGLGIADPYN